MMGRQNRKYNNTPSVTQRYHKAGWWLVPPGSVRSDENVVTKRSRIERMTNQKFGSDKKIEGAL